MKKITEKCPFCQKELEADSEKLYWHIKIHEAIQDATVQNEGIEIKPNPPTPISRSKRESYETRK